MEMMIRDMMMTYGGDEVNQSYVELLRKRLLIEKEKSDRSGIYGISQRMMAYNSNKIEGSTLTEKQTASIFETGTLLGENVEFRTKDVEEMTGHFAMFNYMLSCFDEELSQEMIKAYHYKLKAGVFEDIANGYPIGEYKNRRNMVSDIVTAPPDKVSEEMEHLLSRYHGIPQKSLTDIARLHAEYERIHPFQDGNGRTGRMILFKECLKNQMVPIVIEDSKKAQYYKVLNIGQTEERFEPMVAFFKEEQEIFYELTRDFVMNKIPVEEMKLNQTMKEIEEELEME